MKKLTWKTEKRKVQDLVPADYNPRKISEQERRDLEESIEEFGQVTPIVVNIGKRKDTLIGGHQRTSLYADLGYETVDVMVPSRELTEDEERRLNLRLNKNTGTWDHDKLKEMDLTLLLEVGFGDEDLQMFFDDVEMFEDSFDRGESVKEIKTPHTMPGDVYQMGDHRIMCGDPLNAEDMDTLMQEDLADMVYCDPPNSISHDYSRGLKGEGNYNGVKDKSKKIAEYAKFIDLSIQQALGYSKPNTHIFYWTDEKYIWLIQEIYHANKTESERVCLWIKTDQTLKPSLAFNKIYEPCVYGTRGKPFLNTNIKSLNEILNAEIGEGNQVTDQIQDMLTIWLDKKNYDTDMHTPNQKPVTLAEKPLKRCTAPGHIILDLFGGAGNTIIASQQLKRKARVMESDPVLVDIAVQRWENFSNQKAKKI